MGVKLMTFGGILWTLWNVRNKMAIEQRRSYVHLLGSADPNKFVKKQWKSVFLTIFTGKDPQHAIHKTPFPFSAGFVTVAAVDSTVRGELGVVANTGHHARSRSRVVATFVQVAHPVQVCTVSRKL